VDARPLTSFGSALVVVGALLGSAFGGASGSGSFDPCAGFATVHTAGRVADHQLDEISGITPSGLGPDVLWAEEDSGNEPSIFALRATGAKVQTVDVDGATNVDWEDLARASGRLWVGDIGDNGAERSSIQVYWFDEPGPGVTSVRPNLLTLSYPDGPHDAEGMLVSDGRLYLFEKQVLRSRSRVYAVGLGGLETGADRRLELAGTVDMRLITGASLGRGGIVLSTYTGTRLYPWAGDVRSTLAATPCPVPLIGSEAVTWSFDGRRIFSVPEGTSSTISYAGPPLS
jgi:hypothetical protein